MEPAEKKKEKKKCECSDKGRNLIVCIDGTSKKFGERVRVSVLSSSLSVIIFRPFHRTPMSLNCTARS